MSAPAVRTKGEIQAAQSQAVALDVLDAIARVKTPDEAESLLAKVKIAAEAARVMHLGKALSREWRSIEIKAERKWGELLGKADQQGRRTDLVSDTHKSPSPAERTAVKEARKLAAVPEPVFEQYVETTETPTKAGLLRAAETATQEAAIPPTQTAPTKRQTNIANATRNRVDKALHVLDGMCVALASVDPQNATMTATEEQISQWLATADRARNNLRQFTARLPRQTRCP